jgi:hypothetical protein
VLDGAWTGKAVDGGLPHAKAAINIDAEKSMAGLYKGFILLIMPH